jgi:hypothetical protein
MSPGRLRTGGGSIISRSLRVGDCVRIPDGRVGRARDVSGDKYRVRVRRTTCATHQFVLFTTGDLRHVECPKGWMSPEGYTRYLEVTLTKPRQRELRPKEAR